MLKLFGKTKGMQSYRLLTNELIKLAVVAEFKRSFIGLSWLFLAPLFAIVSWLVLHGAGIIAPGDTGIPYPVFVLLGTSIWGFFLDMYNRTSDIIKANARLMLSADFPPEVLITKEVVVQLVNFVIPVILNVIVIIIFGVKLHWISLLFPLCLIPLVFLATGLGLIVALFRIIAIDLAKLADQFMRLLMFITPVIYSSKIKIKWLEGIITYNPMTYLISMPRDLLARGEVFAPVVYLWCFLGSIVFYLLAFSFFKTASKRVLERLINN